MARPLGQLEAAVMDLMWQRDEPASVREIREDLLREHERGLAYTTVMTVMDNLRQKGFLAREMGGGRAYRYHAVHTRDEHAAALLKQVLSDSDNSGAALLHFVESMPAEDVAELRKVLDGFTAPGGET